MEVLESCNVPYSYSNNDVTPKRHQLSFSTRREIYAKAPLGAASLEASLGRNRLLTLFTVTMAENRLTTKPKKVDDLVGNCDGVTHIITAVTIGAYTLVASSARRGQVSGGYRGVEAGASGESGSTFVNEEGELQRCAEPSAAERWGADCSALLSAELTAVEDPAEVRSRTRCARGMVFVPDPDNGHASGYDDGTNYVGGFCLDKEEVRVRDYRRCVRDDKCMDLPATATPDDLEQLGLSQETGNDLCAGAHPGSSGDEPVNCVDWNAARAYCESVGKRLPSAADWRLATTGSGQNRRYPWGQDEPTDRHANACNRECIKAKFWLDTTWIEGLTDRRDGAVGPANGGQYSKGDGRHGIRDLAGNVAEWSEDGFVHGGSFLTRDPSEFESLAFESIELDARRPDVGFRCATEPKR